MNTDSHHRLLSALWGISLFLVWGLILITGEIPVEWVNPAVFGITSLFIMILVLPIGLLYGWTNYFPRWSYPFVGNVFLFSLYLMNASTPGFLFGRELWGWRAWIPFLLVGVIATLLTRSFKPVITFFENIHKDWSLLTFGMFGFMPIAIFAFYDEMDRLYSLYWMVALTIIMCGTAFLYLYSKDRQHQITALVIGLTVTSVFSILGPALYWKEPPWLFQIEVIMIEIVIMLIPAWVHLIGKFLLRRSV